MRHIHSTRSVTSEHSRRAGSVLVIVLVIVALLSLGAYSFSEFMLIEAESSDFHTRAAQSREAADSGVEMVASYLADRVTRTPSASYSNPDLFSHQALASSTAASTYDLGRFSVVSPVLTDTTAQSIRFGLRDESSKININQLSTMVSDQTQARQFLLGIPNMTNEIADAILDWVDTDSQPRQNGAEQSAYTNSNPPVMVRNGPLQSLDEMLFIQGITPELFFGEDLNRNGLLDPNENDGNLQPPNDNADGLLQRGFVDYFTIYSRESNVKADGTAKININDKDLRALHGAISAAFDANTANFVVTYRTSGPKQAAQQPNQLNQPKQPNQPRQPRQPQPQQNQQQPDMVGDVDIAGGSKFTLKSLYELIGVELNSTPGKKAPPQNPWSKEPGEMMSYLPKMFDTFALDDQPVRQGRININQAPAEVMMYIPGIDQQVVQAIVAAQSATGDVSPDRLTNGWLVTRNLVPLERMVQLDPFITGQGDVYRFQVVGYHDRGGPMTRIEAVLDGGTINPQILMFQDLTRLGSGYSRTQLGLTTPQ